MSNARHVYLIGAGQPQSVEDWYKHMSWYEQAQEVGAAQEPVLGPKGVDLRRSAQDGHGGLESGQQGQGHRKAGHGAVGHQKLLGEAKGQSTNRNPVVHGKMKTTLQGKRGSEMLN